MTQEQGLINCGSLDEAMGMVQTAPVWADRHGVVLFNGGADDLQQLRKRWLPGSNEHTLVMPDLPSGLPSADLDGGR